MRKRRRPRLTRQQVIATARSYLGTPYHHAARVKGVGVDCAGLVLAVARDLDYTDFDVAGYGRAPDGRLLPLLREHLEEIPRGNARPGDVLCLRIRTEPQHLAILSTLGGEPSLIHAHEGLGQVAEHRLDDLWARRVVAAFRFRGIEDE